MFKKGLFVFILLGLHTALFAQNCELTFNGVVIDNHDDQPLIGAIVRLGEQGVVTDVNGRFAFKNLCLGNYELSISHIDCENLDENISIENSISKTFYLEHHQELIEEIIVSEYRNRAEESKASIIITEEEIKEKQGKTFGDLLASVEGVTLLKTGSSITKPVINGLHSQRVLVVNNGMQMEGQQWGLEHAPEIDPYTVQSIQVIKGAGSVEYGADALGGVVLVSPVALPDFYGTSITTNLAGFSNGRSGNLALNILGKQKLLGLPLSFQAQGSLKKAGNLKAPDYFLDNTGVEEANFMLRAGYLGDEFGVEGKVSQYNSNLGILTDSHIGNESDLLAIIENGRPFVDRGFSYEILRPRQKILHEIAQIDAYLNTSVGKIEGEFSRQYNRRGEYDRSETEPGLRLKTETYNSKMTLTHSLHAKMNGKVGLQGSSQTYKADGFYLIPEYDYSTLAAFITENYKVNDQLLLEAGLRYDYKKYTYYIPFNEFTLLDDSSIQYNSKGQSIGEVETKFTDLVTGSFGLSYDVNDDLSVSSYIGFGARQPLPNELYSDGVHHGTAFWEVGDPTLDTEYSRSLQLNTNYSKNKFSGTINGFWNSIDNYSYLIPDQSFDPIFTIRGSFPIRRMLQNDVDLVGFDYRLKAAELNEKFDLQTGGSFLWGRDKELNQPLIYMPANRLNHSITYNTSNTFKASLALQNVFEQKRVPNEDVINDFGTIPPAYNLVDLGLTYSTILGQNDFSAQASVENIFNTTYKDYLDRFRYFADSPGINFGLRLTYTIK